jgi:hypothetical protein
LSWYPPPDRFENSGKNVGRWTESEEVDFLARKRRNTAVEPDRNAKGIKQRPQRITQWKDGLRGSSDVHRAFSRINCEARAVISNR